MNICVFGASGTRLRREYYDAAEELGYIIAQRGHRLVFGGGEGGLMGAAAKGARRSGAAIIGVAPRFFDEPGILDKSCSEFIFTDTMAQRKEKMEELADAFIALPGGIGTFEEFFEALTLKQLGRHSKPIAVLNTLGYYDAMQRMLKSAAEGAFMSENVLKLYTLCSSPAEAVDASESAAAACECGGVQGYIR